MNDVARRLGFSVKGADVKNETKTYANCRNASERKGVGHEIESQFIY